MVNGIWLAVLGILGASSIIIAKKPEAKDIIAKMAPYQGWIGAVSALWGAWGVISAVLHMSWLAHWPIYWATWLGDSVLQFGLGLILGIGVLKTFIKNPEAGKKMDETLEKLLPYQGNLGLAAIGLGIWMVVSSLIWTVG
jgi:hypothetical protein